MIQPHDKQEVILQTDPSWSFDDKGPCARPIERLVSRRSRLHDAWQGPTTTRSAIIALSGKRIPIHPAMTRYLVAHEYGHFVEDWLTRERKLKERELREQYLTLVRPDASHDYGCGRWHANIGEIFANDFRILITKRESEFWPHPGVSRPEDNLAAVGWWTKIRDEFWTTAAEQAA